MATDPVDKYLEGVRDSSVTLSGTWDPSQHDAVRLLAPAGERREMDLVMGQRRLFGVDWWASRRQFTACITGWDPATGEMTFSVASEVKTVRSEWWRRLMYALVRHLPERSTDGD